MPEVQSPHRKNRARQGPHLKKCPHCGGKVEALISAPVHPIQRLRLVRNRLRREKSRRGDSAKDDKSSSDKKDSTALEGFLKGLIEDSAKRFRDQQRFVRKDIHAKESKGKKRSPKNPRQKVNRSPRNNAGELIVPPQSFRRAVTAERYRSLSDSSPSPTQFQAPTSRQRSCSYNFKVFKYSRKSFPNSSFCNANSTVAFKNPSLSPASYEIPS